MPTKIQIQSAMSLARSRAKRTISLALILNDVKLKSFKETVARKQAQPGRKHNAYS